MKVWLLWCRVVMSGGKRGASEGEVAVRRVCRAVR